MKLDVITWDGPVARTEENEAPTVADVRVAIARLDGAACTEVCLARHEPFASFTVAGGPELYLVTGETADEDLLQLTEPDAGNETVPLVCGGQRADFARRDLVNRGTAIDVLVRFLENGDYDASLPWHVQ